MKRMPKGLLFIFVIGLFLFFPTSRAHAASASIRVTGANKTVVVGNTVRATITVSSSTNLGSWSFDVKYDSSKLTFVSSNLEGSTRSVGYAPNGSTKSKTYTITFRAKASGSAKVWVANSLVYSYGEAELSSSNGSYTFNLITQQQLEASYSKNNNLSSLSVDGYELQPKFSKDTLEYSLELENGVESVKINAKAEDSKASINGTGVKQLTEGDNQFKIRVIAENGTTKDYVVNIHVKELNPVYVTVDGEEYTVLRKTEGLSIPSTFTESTTFIEEEEVPIFESEITGYRIIALKDKEGQISFFKMEENGGYIPYQETTFNGITIFVLTPKKEDIPKGYETKKTTIIDLREVPIYTSKNDTYPLIYGINIETGKTNWYSYDAEERTLQKFDNSQMEALTLKNERFLLLIALLSASSFLIIVFLLIYVAKVKKHMEKEM